MHCHLVPLMIVESHLGRLDVHFLLAVGQAHGQRDAAVAQCQIQIVRAVSRVEEQSVRLASAKVEGDRVLGTHYGLGPRLAQIVREELCTAERCFRWRLLLLTVLAIVFEIATLANWTGISGYAYATMLARIVTLTGIGCVATAHPLQKFE